MSSELINLSRQPLCAHSLATKTNHLTKAHFFCFQGQVGPRDLFVAIQTNGWLPVYQKMNKTIRCP